jgi:hypothetical protein
MVTLTVKDMLMEKLYKQIDNEVFEYTEEDYARYELDKAEAEARAQLEATKKAEAKLAREAAEAKLAALGLTTDDLKALGLGSN